MVEIQGQIVPTDEEEMEFLEDLYAVTGEARKAGLDVDDIVISLNFVAASIRAADEQDSPEGPDAVAESKIEDCPQCGEEIENVKPFIGGEVEVQPCGCSIYHERVAGWLQ